MKTKTTRKERETMHGKIYFNYLEDLAAFLKAFRGSTATFEVYKVQDRWVLEFLGGY